nr:MAG TPA: hypothetical protein [Caudoviricetes sp.]
MLDRLFFICYYHCNSLLLRCQYLKEIIFKLFFLECICYTSSERG